MAKYQITIDGEMLNGLFQGDSGLASRWLVKSGRPSGKIGRWWKSNRVSRMPMSCGLFADLTNHR